MNIYYFYFHIRNKRSSQVPHMTKWSASTQLVDDRSTIPVYPQSAQAVASVPTSTLCLKKGYHPTTNANQ